MPGGWGAVSHGWSGRAFLGRTHVSTHQKDVSLWAMRVPGGHAPGHGNHKQRWEVGVCPVHPRVSKEAHVDGAECGRGPWGRGGRGRALALPEEDGSRGGHEQRREVGAQHR